MRILLIINPAAGQDWKRAALPPARVIQASFQSHGHQVEVEETQARGDATRAAESAVTRGFDMVIAAGGDGTVNEVVNGLVGSKVIFSLVPLGTENVLAKEMGIPFDVGRACEFIEEAAVRRVDVGKVKDRFFLSFAGVGLDAQAVSEVPSRLKAQLGSLAFFLTGLRMAWKYRKASPKATLHIDEETLVTHFWLIIIGNIPSYGWKVKVTPKASVDDGLLDVCVFPKTTYLGIIFQVMVAFLGMHLKLPEIRYFRGKKITIKARPRVMVEADGELVGWTPAEISVIPAALSVKF
ncbi:MAG: diacylglycerol kinase family lipid kinase [Candidatus Eremiobacteraeota bacterium]|nr:diacylglycerol kinase family lipid kinase [Candidatus Eremiobacteraeota bacterium]